MDKIIYRLSIDTPLTESVLTYLRNNSIFGHMLVLAIRNKDIQL
jgi:hypothetical protein